MSTWLCGEMHVGNRWWLCFRQDDDDLAIMRAKCDHVMATDGRVKAVRIKAYKCGPHAERGRIVARWERGLDDELWREVKR